MERRELPGVQDIISQLPDQVCAPLLYSEHAAELYGILWPGLHTVLRAAISVLSEEGIAERYFGSDRGFDEYEVAREGEQDSFVYAISIPV